MDILRILLSSLASLAILFILAKLMGNKQISQITTFDYITGITIGSIAAEMATDLEGSIFPEATAMIVYGLITCLISYITNKSMWARKFFTGKPIIIFENNKLYRDRLLKAHLDINDFLAMCRLAGFFDLSQVESAILEHNGNISFMPKSTERPVTPQDMALNIDMEKPFVDVIIDGKVIYENLKNIGKNIGWVKNTIKEYGYSDESQVFLLLADTENNVRIYGFENKG